MNHHMNYSYAAEVIVDPGYGATTVTTGFGEHYTTAGGFQAVGASVMLSDDTSSVTQHFEASGDEKEFATELALAIENAYTMANIYTVLGQHLEKALPKS